MASQHNNSFKPQSPESGLVLDNRNFLPSQDTSLQWEEDICNFSTAQLNFPTNDNGYCAKQELQAMWKWFTSWLKPEKCSKEQMISQLVLAEFLKTGHYKDKSVLKEKWESNGRNLGRFMEDLTDECLKPPIMVHTSMQGQEASFSKNRSLEETINLLKEQQSARSSIQESARTPLPIPQDMLLTTGHEDWEDSQNNGWSNSDVNDGDSSTGNEMDSLFLIQQVQFNEPKDRSVSDGNPLDLSRTSQVTSRYRKNFIEELLLKMSLWRYNQRLSPVQSRQKTARILMQAPHVGMVKREPSETQRHTNMKKHAASKQQVTIEDMTCNFWIVPSVFVDKEDESVLC
ncbi:zinc finger and SCAN domain containing protein 4D-like [Peromyscus eremicus]|uniref:zinc finger and SCAN domain containing protein 4D-like n=1 Tax=Peromyscus eremicus TaxID=42410 RepID=UPI0027DBAFFA|nr:zinc finger and SCAN domain containing protein 4D-like [Peromyscus eremicus]